MKDLKQSYQDVLDLQKELASLEKRAKPEIVKFFAKIPNEFFSDCVMFGKTDLIGKNSQKGKCLKVKDNYISSDGYMLSNHDGKDVNIIADEFFVKEHVLSLKELVDLAPEIKKAMLAVMKKKKTEFSDLIKNHKGHSTFKSKFSKLLSGLL